MAGPRSPLERLKIEFQVQDILHDKSHKLDKSLVRGIMQIYQRDGVKGWFKGNGTNVLRMLPYSSTQFWTYERVKEVIMKGKPAGTKDITPVERLGAGAVSGVVSAGLTYPLDVIRGRLTVQGPTTSFHYKGITDAFITMSRQEGLRGLYRGITATIVGIMPYMGTQFMVYGGLKSQMQEWFGTGPDKRNVPQWVALFNGGLAGAAAQTGTFHFAPFLARPSPSFVPIRRTARSRPFSQPLFHILLLPCPPLFPSPVLLSSLPQWRTRSTCCVAATRWRAWARTAAAGRRTRACSAPSSRS